MEDNYKIRVGITHGDINGVGYEVILKTFFGSYHAGTLYTHYLWIA